MDIIEIFGIFGAIASIVGLVMYFIKNGRKELSQFNSSTIHGKRNKVTIQNNIVNKKANLYENHSTFNQKNSSIIHGSYNNVSINIDESAEYAPLINITKSYRHLKEFSVSSFGGVFEIQELFVEVIEFIKCVPVPPITEAMMFRTYYHVNLTPRYKYYPLLSRTVRDKQNVWILRGDDIELFGIHFSWPSLTSVELVLKAKLFDHKLKSTKYIKSEVIELSRNGEGKTEHRFKPDNEISQSVSINDR